MFSVRGEVSLVTLNRCHGGCMLMKPEPDDVGIVPRGLFPFSHSLGKSSTKRSRNFCFGKTSPVIPTGNVGIK